MLSVLGLIDVVMIANLLIMVIIGGYETFVSKIDIEGHPDQPEWLSHVNANVLKVKLAMAIIGISSIHLLKTFIEVGDLGDPGSDTEERASTGDVYTGEGVFWQVIIHIVFIISAIALAFDRPHVPEPRGRRPQPDSPAVRPGRRPDRSVACAAGRRRRIGLHHRRKVRRAAVAARRTSRQTATSSGRREGMRAPRRDGGRMLRPCLRAPFPSPRSIGAPCAPTGGTRPARCRRRGSRCDSHPATHRPRPTSRRGTGRLVGVCLALRGLGGRILGGIEGEPRRVRLAVASVASRACRAAEARSARRLFIASSTPERTSSARRRTQSVRSFSIEASSPSREASSARPASVIS